MVSPGRIGKSAGARVLTGTEKILATLSRKDNPQMVISAFRQRHS